MIKKYDYLGRKKMGILIADSGATKTSWAYISPNEVKELTTPGLNPVMLSDAGIKKVITGSLLPALSNRLVEHIYFYGAGCRAEDQASRIRNILSEFFRDVPSEIRTDIEGAGISVFGDGLGIVVISGTGSSAGFMSGGSIMEMMPSPAYPKGDTGSGCHIGALILRDYFTGKIPVSLKEILDLDRRLNFESLFLDFQDPRKTKKISAQAMADVANTITLDTFEDAGYLRDLATTSVRTLLIHLRSFFGKDLYEYPVKFVGSTAFYFKDVFEEVFQTAQIRISEIRKTPMEGLISFHKEELS